MTTMGKDVIILKQTNIVPLAPINCTYSEEISDSAMLTNIASMQQVAAEQLVCLKVEVAHVQAVKTINTHHGSALKKQELIVRDPTGFIKLILWEDYVDCLQQHKTYHLQNVRVKVSKDEKYINTPKSEKFSFDEVEKFERDLVPIENDMVSLTMATVHGKIVGVMNVSKSVVCISCFKKVTPKTDKVGNCESCKVMQFLNSCPRHWYLRVLVQTNENKKLRLSMFNQCVQSLVELLGSENCDLKHISEDDLMLYILESEKSFVIDYETDHSKITSIKVEPSA